MSAWDRAFPAHKSLPLQGLEIQVFLPLQLFEKLAENALGIEEFSRLFWYGGLLWTVDVVGVSDL